MQGKKKKNKGMVLPYSVVEEEMFENVSNIVNICDSLIDDEIRTEVSDVKDMANVLFTMTMSLELAYVCFRRRLHVLFDALHDLAGSPERSLDDISATIDDIRIGHKEFMNDIMHEDGVSFLSGIEIVPLGDLEPEARINMKGGDA